MRLKVAIACTAVTVAAALVLRWETARHEITGQASSCRISEALDCDLVQASPYARIFGVSLSVWGAAGGLILLAWLLGARRGSAGLLKASGALAAFHLLAALATAYLSWVEIGAICLYCTIMQLAIVATAALVIPAALRAGGQRAARPPVVVGGLVAVIILAIAMAGDAYASQRAELERLYVRPTGNALRIDISDTPDFGSRDAKAESVLYFDFGCPRCAECYEKASYLLEKHPGRVHFIFKNYPLDRRCNAELSTTSHPSACRAARAVLAAHQLGHGRAAMTYLFEHRPDFTWPVIEGLARQIGVSVPEFKERMKSPAIQQLLERDVAEGNALKLDAVPGAWLNGRLIDASRLVDRVERLIGR